MPPKPKEAKVVVLGDAGVGKTSVIQRFTAGTYDEFTKATIGASFASQTVRASNGENIKLAIWDTAGQEQFQSMAPIYYRNASAGVVIFDLLDMNSFTKAKFWIDQLQTNGPPGVVITIVGNKVDREIERKVPAEIAQEYAKEIDAGYFETSAKTGHDVSELFTHVANEVFADGATQQGGLSNHTGMDLSIGSNKTDSDRKKKACCKS